MTVSRLSSRVAVALLLFLTLLSGQARADDREVARKLFETGRQLGKEGDWKAACIKFKASLALYEAVGTLLNLASCHEREKRLATALSTYRRAELLNRDTKGQARREKVARFLRQQEAKLEPKVPTLLIVIDNPPEELSMSRNGRSIPVGALGEAIPVDPGEQRITATAPGWHRAEKKIDLLEGEHKQVVLVLEPNPDGASSAVQTGSGVVLPSVLTGLGLLTLGVGLGFTIHGVASTNELDRLCGGQLETCKLPNAPPGYSSPQDALDSLNEGKNLGYYVGIPATVVGTVGTGLGAFWLYTRLNKSSEHGAAHWVLLPTAQRGGAGLLWSGAF